MKTWTALLFAVIAAAVLAAALLWPSDERRIRRLFDEGARAFEAEDTDRVMARVSYSFCSEPGITYLNLREYLKRFFAMASEIEVEYDDIEVRVEGKTAEVKIKTLVSGTIGSESGYILGDLREPFAPVFTLEKEQGRWLVTAATGFSAGTGRMPGL